MGVVATEVFSPVSNVKRTNEGEKWEKEEKKVFISCVLRVFWMNSVTSKKLSVETVYSSNRFRPSGSAGTLGVPFSRNRHRRDTTRRKKIGGKNRLRRKGVES